MTAYICERPLSVNKASFHKPRKRKVAWGAPGHGEKTPSFLDHERLTSHLLLPREGSGCLSLSHRDSRISEAIAAGCLLYGISPLRAQKLSCWLVLLNRYQGSAVKCTQFSNKCMCACLHTACIQQTHSALV